MDYKEAQQKIGELKHTIEALENQIPIPQHRDKCGLDFCGVSDYNNPTIELRLGFLHATIAFGASHGSYGNSSTKDDMSPQLAHYVLRACRSQESSIIRRAIELAREDIKKLATELEAEAIQIVQLARGA